MTLMTLDEHLSECYGARYGFRPAGALERLVKALRDDPALLEAARARLAELETITAARSEGRNHGCVLTKAAHEHLRAALAKVETP